jgi:hypothetical protein
MHTCTHAQWVRPKDTYGIEVDGFQVTLPFPGPDVTELPLRIALHRRPLVRGGRGYVCYVGSVGSVGSVRCRNAATGFKNWSMGREGGCFC